MADERGDDDFEQLDAEEAEKAKQVKEHLSQQIDSHFSSLENDFRSVFDQRMAAIESHCKAQASEAITSRQSDILRTNKVFREICRPLGTKWRAVFDFLTAGLPADRVQAELTKLNNEKPFMQPYKSLMIWKEMKAEEFNIRDLIPALKFQGLDDLVEKAQSILNCDDTEALIDLSCIGKTKVAGAGSGSIATGCKSTASSNPSELGLPPNVNAEESLDDRHILQLAKKLGTSWEQLARTLNVPDGEIAEILETEAVGGYQAAFKMLWNWRETKTDLRQGLEQLISALRQLNQHDLVGLLI